MTLIEELEQAADEAVSTGEAFIIQGGTEAATRKQFDFAAQLRARVEHMKGLFTKWGIATHDEHLPTAMRAGYALETAMEMVGDLT